MAKAATKKAEKTTVFGWEGTDRKGKKVTGESRAASAKEVQAELKRQGIKPGKVAKKKQKGRRKKISSKEIAVLARQLATMMKAGVPLVQAFDIVGRGHDNLNMQDLLMTIKGDVEGGASFADSLRKHPLQFDTLFCNLVEAGEHAGILDTLLDKIALYREKTESIKGKVKKALFYPISVMVVAIIVVAIIMIFVVPQFEDMFRSFGADLPAPTQIVINISKIVQEWWWAILIGLGASYYGISELLKRSPKLRENIDRALLHAPVFGDLMRKSAIARFSRTLGTMFAAGVPLVESLGSVAGATGNVVYGNAVLKIREDVATGQSLTVSMRQTDLFPNLVVQMVTIGEESGSLDSMLSKVADFFEEEVDNAVDALTSMLEPLVMVILGGLVGSIIVALYLPIFQLGEVVGH